MEFVERFLIKDPIQDFQLPINCSEWFDPKIIERHEKRKLIVDIIKSIVADGIPLPLINFFE